MKVLSLRMYLTLVFILSCTIGAGPALAEKPSWAGNDKSEKHEKGKKQESYEGHHGGSNQGGYEDRKHHEAGKHDFFTDQQRGMIQGYYDTQYQKGNCPPGLRKKGNGCMPPGQAKKWTVGQPLPRDVIFHDLPPRLYEQLGPPPPNHRFVRVAQDVLLITTGVGMVVDAIEDLNWQFDH